MVSIPFISSSKDEHRDKTDKRIIALRVKAKKLRAKRNHWIRKAERALRRNDPTEAEIYKKEAKEYEKLRIWTLDKIHKLEQRKAWEERKEWWVKVTKDMERARSENSSSELDEDYEMAKVRMREIDLSIEEDSNDLNLALIDEGYDPEDAERLVENEIKENIRRDVEPAEEARKLREQIKREMTESE